MKPIWKYGITLSVAVLLLALGAPAFPAANPAQHPAYLHALTDLRFARAHLERPDGGALRQQESDAIGEIDRAIDEIKKAAMDDGKNLHDHPPVDAHMEWGGRLRKSLELLDKAHHDIEHEEDDPAARGLRERALEHIDKAHHHVEEAIRVVR
jgi:hypothetical protein